MKNKITLFVSIFAVTLLLGVTLVLAHVHPLVPADECALGDGAGNTALPQNGDNGQQFNPGLIPVDNPWKAEGSKGAVGVPAIFSGGPGVGPATSNCANA